MFILVYLPLLVVVVLSLCVCECISVILSILNNSVIKFWPHMNLVLPEGAPPPTHPPRRLFDGIGSISPYQSMLLPQPLLLGFAWLLMCCPLSPLGLTPIWEARETSHDRHYQLVWPHRQFQKVTPLSHREGKRTLVIQTK